MWRQDRPVVGVLEQLEGVGVSLEPTGYAGLLSLLDFEKPSDGEIYDGAVMSRMSGLLSIRVPISAGVMPSGGLY